MNEPVSNTYQLDSAWRVGVLMADGGIAFNPESPLYSEHEAHRIAEARHADRPFMRFIAVPALGGGDGYAK